MKTMNQKSLFFSVVMLNLLAFQPVAGQEANPLLAVRILEKENPQELELQFPAGRGPWNQVNLARGLLTVNGKAQAGASWGSLDTMVKIRTPHLTRIYRGQIEVSTQNTATGTELVILNRIPLSDYTACVTAFESAYDHSQPEYLKALAVVVRAYALGHLHRHGTYDLCDLSHCQVYQGIPPKFPFWKQMAEAGAGFSFPPAVDAGAVYYNRCCGGMLESADQIWGGAPSPSRTGPDEWEGEILCQADPLFHWSSSADLKKVESVLKTMAHLPSDAVLKTFKVAEKTASGRNKTLAATFLLPGEGTREIRENAIKFESEFGKNYGWRVFPSDLFSITQEGDTYHFTGRGFGHGVGLCESGALRLAQLGWGWEKILNFYFPSR